MLNLEDECYMMGPLIDQQLQKIDYKHATLEDLNLKILEAFQMYNNLMKDSLNKSNTFGNPASIYSANNSNSMVVPTNNYMPTMISSQANSIPFVAAPPQTAEASAHLLANQLNSFAVNNNNNTFSNIQQPQVAAAAAAALQNYNQNYSSYSNYSLPNEHLNVNQQQVTANNFMSIPMSNQNGLPNTNGINSDNNYQLNVQYGQPS